MVELEKIIEAIESADACSDTFLDAETEEIVWINREIMSDEEVDAACDQLDEHGFYRLPKPCEINDYAIMDSFVDSLPDNLIERIAPLISGRGAFRRFKDAARSLGIEQEWYTWRDSAYKRLAIEWCEENGLEWK